MVYGVAYQIRNWIAMQYVLGTILLPAMAAIAIVQVVLERLPLYEDLAMRGVGVLSNPLWLAASAGVLGWLLPCGLAYWLTHPDPGETTDSIPKWISSAAIADLLLGVLLLLMPFPLRAYDRISEEFAAGLWIVGGTTLLGLAWYWIVVATLRQNNSIGALRVRLTRLLARGLMTIACLIAFGVAFSLSTYLYDSFDSVVSAAVGGFSLGAIVLVARSLSEFVEKHKLDRGVGLLAKQVGVVVAATVLSLALMVAWGYFVQWIRWGGQRPNQLGPHDTLVALAVTLVIAAIAAWITGRYPGFLNLSTLQNLYSGKLTRAYLGASNGNRLFSDGSIAEESVAVPHKSDNVFVAGYSPSNEDVPLAPIHIINTCANETSDVKELLVQRDRKGRSLARTPFGLVYDGEYWLDSTNLKGKGNECLSIGEWIGVSGAAVATGMGRRTGTSTAILLGLSNVRLGRWIATGLGKSSSQSLVSAIRRTFETQSYLLNEIFGSFHGTRRNQQYVSDGGHYDNTGIYELLNPKRGVRLIVACDCGADPDYQFEDLANLIRLARIDYGLEIQIDAEFGSDTGCAWAAASLEELRRSARDPGGAIKCGLALTAHPIDTPKEASPPTRILLMKPVVLRNSPIDLQEYALRNTAFPQEPTADQFFDEAQWESYRRLGLEVGNAVFNQEFVSKKLPRLMG